MSKTQKWTGLLKNKIPKHNYFVRGGIVDTNNKYLNYAGVQGGYWSSTPNSNGNQAYLLGFNASGVYPSNNLNRHYGYSLRCLAR